LWEEVVKVLTDERKTIEELEERIAPRNHELFVDVVREMVDDGILQYDNGWRLKLVQQKK
jgi:ATP-dependent DNA helicase RecQ